jgi:hypothetical protein
MKNTLLIILMMVGVNIFNYSQKAECKKWKNGRFYMLTPDNIRIEIARKGKTQVEYNTQTGKKRHLRVKWLNPCTYQIKDDPTYNDGEEIQGLIITVTIVEIKDNFVTIEFTSNLFSMKLREPFYRGDE